ncbi:hypothetical protein CHGG_09862 [Chaetomium globosum CBS 148.51]|uniref:Uncharacterized protein n=1 Tax=Chaetomium globosum (strain ATCC 6205 / CBS 148.51 / DSM 1962 / NBRC 6347 / NRRL 1970) TaxID=306901 RepID=Q2GQ92_CHAGB|nr:uncharacterized protein CHGG_09862 [Chaetomium globosum CBS 148.51]EAQ83458.1 hypothetical protein CHGG_09862 [Chaetomium globosum CBS 148.51]
MTPFVVPAPTQRSPHQPGIEVIPKRHLTDKDKSSEILHIDTSPTASYVATKHSNKLVKIWSIPKNALHGTIKITSYVQPRVRSREYFIRSHAILSENATLIGITTHFGLTLEIWNFAKGGSGAKKVQVIEEAHRWAASQRDAFHNDYAGLAVYRPKNDRIDRFFLSRHPNSKTPFREDPNHSIELRKSNLPFLPKFPELAYSSDSPILIAAASPRPGDPSPPQLNHPHRLAHEARLGQQAARADPRPVAQLSPRRRAAQALPGLRARLPSPAVRPARQPRLTRRHCRLHLDPSRHHHRHHGHHLSSS